MKRKGKGKLGTNAMKRVAAGAHLPRSWLFEPAKRPDDRADYCLREKHEFNSKMFDLGCILGLIPLTIFQGSHFYVVLSNSDFY